MAKPSSTPAECQTIADVEALAVAIGAARGTLYSLWAPGTPPRPIRCLDAEATRRIHRHTAPGLTKLADSERTRRDAH